MKKLFQLAQRLLILAMLGLITTLYVIFDAPNPGAADAEVNIIVEEGASLTAIARQLHEAGVIRSPRSFTTAARLLNKGRAIYPGSYTIAQDLSNSEALEALSHAKAIEVSVTIPEGWRSDEIVGYLADKLDLDSLKMSALLQDSTLLALAGEGFTHLEGTLFPETYRFLENTDEYTVLRKMVAQFRSHITPDILERAASHNLDLQELLTLASLVEKETALDSERRLVSSVYHNRLKRNMLMGADPTLIYMLVRRGEWNGNIQRKHFKIRDPYNTYLYRGLPPGPIANPGLASIYATLDPETSKYLYFVGKNDGSGAHDFSYTLKEHNKKVDRYQRRRRS